MVAACSLLPETLIRSTAISDYLHAYDCPTVKIAVIGTVASSILGFRREFIECLLAKGHEVYAFAADYSDQQMQEVTQIGAVPIAYKFNRLGMNPFSDISNTIRLAKRLRELKPDLVFSYFIKPVVFGTYAACLAGIKRRTAMLEGLGFIFTACPEGPSPKTKLLRRLQTALYKFSLPRLDQLIFLNPDDQRELLESHQIQVKSHAVLGGIGVNLDGHPYSPAPSNPVSFLFVGRLLTEKGIGEFLQAARMVKAKYPRVHFRVAGGPDTGNPRAISEAEIGEMADTGLVDYLGHVSDIRQSIVQSSVFVLPSYREGVPRSTQEAMAHGRAVITTDVPGCRETVIDGVNGFLVPPWQADALAEKMCFFIEHPEQIERMGLESRRLAEERFDSRIVNQKLLELLGI